MFLFLFQRLFEQMTNLGHVLIVKKRTYFWYLPEAFSPLSFFSVFGKYMTVTKMVSGSRVSILFSKRKLGFLCEIAAL